MGDLKLAYMYIAGGADPKKHRTVIPTPDGLKITAVGVSSYSEAAGVCRELVKEGVQMIELCPGFGNVGAGKVADAVGDDAVIGVVRTDGLPLLDCKSGDTLFK